jgi:hypothetical protein
MLTDPYFDDEIHAGEQYSKEASYPKLYKNTEKLKLGDRDHTWNTPAMSIMRGYGFGRSPSRYYNQFVLGTFPFFKGRTLFLDISTPDCKSTQVYLHVKRSTTGRFLWSWET